MNLKIKTLHDLMTMAVWLDNVLDSNPLPLSSKGRTALRVLLWDTNDEITSRLISENFCRNEYTKTKNDDNITA